MLFLEAAWVVLGKFYSLGELLLGDTRSCVGVAFFEETNMNRHVLCSPGFVIRSSNRRFEIRTISYGDSEIINAILKFEIVEDNGIGG